MNTNSRKSSLMKNYSHHTLNLEKQQSLLLTGVCLETTKAVRLLKEIISISSPKEPIPSNICTEEDPELSRYELILMLLSNRYYRTKYNISYNSLKDLSEEEILKMYSSVLSKIALKNWKKKREKEMSLKRTF